MASGVYISNLEKLRSYYKVALCNRCAPDFTRELQVGLELRRMAAQF